MQEDGNTYEDENNDYERSPFHVLCSQWFQP